MANSPEYIEARVDVVEQYHGQVARLVLHGDKGNALDLTLVSSLRQAVDAVSRWPELRAVIVEGAGLHFSTGHPRLQLAPPMVAGLLEAFHDAVRSLLDLNALIIAAVRGRCEGAGTALALSADLAVADSTAQLKFLESDGAPPPLLAVLLAGRLDRGGAAKLLLGDHGLSGEQAVLRGLMSDCATGWEGAGAIVERHVRQLALAPNRETLQQVIQTIRAPLLTWMGESLPSVERRAVERAGRSEETTASPKWRPGY